jgi:hypothetical protein
MDLTDPGEDSCFSDEACHEVELLKPGESVTIELYNKEFL